MTIWEIALVAGAALTFSIAVAIAFRQDVEERKTWRKLRHGVSAYEQVHSRAVLPSPVLGMLAALGRVILRRNKPDKLSRDLVLAGLFDPNLPYFVVGISFLVVVICALIILMVGKGGVLPAVMSVGLGLLLARGALSRYAQSRGRRIRHQLPVALDILRISLESGAGTEQAFRFLATLTPHPAPLLKPAFEAFTKDIDQGMSYEQALDRFAVLAPVEDVRLVTDIVKQSFRYGTETLDALKILGEELRKRRLNEARERVGYATTAMTVIMVVFLLPALLVVAGAPALTMITNVLGNIGR